MSNIFTKDNKWFNALAAIIVAGGSAGLIELAKVPYVQDHPYVLAMATCVLGLFTKFYKHPEAE